MRIGITGTTGRLGHALLQACSAHGHEAFALPRATLDLIHDAEFPRILNALELDALINPAALTNVDACEGSAAAELAYQINAKAPASLARWAAQEGVRFLHISTDYVFSGKESGLRSEDDPTEPVQAYGQSKLAGERGVLEASSNHLVARVSWIYGGLKPSFLEMAIHRAQEQEQAEAIADKWSLPLRASEGADFLLQLLPLPEAQGILHLCHSGEPASWLDWAQAGIEVLKELNYPFKTPHLVAQQAAKVPFFLAQRPIHTAMSTEKVAQLTGKKPSHWREAVANYVRANHGEIARK